MALKTTQFIQTLLLCIIAGQAFFFLIGGTAGLKNVSASTFIEQRKAIDLVIGPYLKVIYLISVLVSTVVLILLRQQVGSFSFLLSTGILVLILIDLTIALKGNIPLNQLIQSWSLTDYPANWATIRDQWLAYMYWREACSITALLCALLGVYFQI
ncbi:hypothetical protein GO755_13920 [Spirosoma sp. HMF4905]|uniref:DUF1772 domain-containing protein n=1 Tax=Spirosoma arboris TaxID=2682092 RepID=A0A7K1SBD3_9BACT|nr:hypothetical protein [Spirosoma arboris]MVM31134.1 hypothetical protein [Spirosoma arboris]